ncbi:MAG TPA: universal stress protein [Trebonia sp.]|jgi:nucleotide-binding universal stress UspA family protein|nr:universal stress protein [Trebonia sp.]
MPGIIVGIDGSDHSLRALEWAIGEAAVRQTPLTVVTVVQQPAPGYWGYHVPYLGDEDVVDQARKMARVETDRALDKAGAGSRPASVAVQAVTGFPGEALLLAAEGADLLVVGSRGVGGFKRLLLGSVGVQVTHHAHCPVVVIPAEGS